MYQVTTVIIILTEDGYLYDNYDVVDDEWGFARETEAGGRGGVVRKKKKKSLTLEECFFDYLKIFLEHDLER